MTGSPHSDIDEEWDDDDMDEQDWLVQRFVDQDLSPQERLEFLKAMDRDPVLRKHVLATEEMLVRSFQLPRIPVPRDFKANILKQLDPPPKKWWQPIWSVLFAPRVMPWNPAMAMMAAGILLGIFWLLKVPVIPPGDERRATSSEVKMVSLDSAVSGPVMVRLVLLEPQAQSVAVAGDFNGWKPQETPLHRTEDGAWTVTLQVKPGRYHYMFVVDGQEWVTDPFAREYSSDGFGAKNAVLDVSHAL